MTVRIPQVATDRLLHVAPDGYRTGVATVAPAAGHERTLVACLGYAAAADPFELQRFAVLAEALAARVVVVETPGYGAGRTRLRPAERWALVRGDVVPLAERVLGAACWAVGGPPDGLLGYSLGASVAAAATVAHRRAGGPELGTVTLVEPVAVRRWSGAGLAGAMRQEDRLIEDYLHQTAHVPGAVAPTDRTPGAAPAARWWPDMLIAASALRAGRIGADLAAGLTGTRTTVALVHGTGSWLSDAAACAAVVRGCRQRGLDAHDVPVPGSHGLWHSLPAVAALALEVRRTAGWAP